MNNDFLTTSEVAERIFVTENRVRQLIKEGKLESRKIGRKYLVPKVLVDRYSQNVKWDHDPKIIKKRYQHLLDIEHFIQEMIDSLSASHTKYFSDFCEKSSSLDKPDLEKLIESNLHNALRDHLPDLTELLSAVKDILADYKWKSCYIKDRIRWDGIVLADIKILCDDFEEPIISNISNAILGYRPTSYKFEVKQMPYTHSLFEQGYCEIYCQEYPAVFSGSLLFITNKPETAIASYIALSDRFLASEEVNQLKELDNKLCDVSNKLKKSLENNLHSCEIWKIRCDLCPG